MALNKSCVGREYPAVEARVTREAIRNYALACNEDNPRYLDDAAAPGGIIAPPMFGVVVTWESLLRASGDPEVGVDLMRLLHGEQEMEFHAPIRPHDVITSRSRIASIETRATGEALDIEIAAHNQSREPVLRAVTGIFIRGGKRERLANAPGAREISRPEGEPMVVMSQTIDRDQTFRYAEASGDHNPIHLDENVARMVGLSGIIVHGLCTMAFAARVMVDALCDRDPARLKRLRVRFARPVLPGQTINTLVWDDGGDGARRRHLFETYNPDGQAVIRGGIAEVTGGA